MPGELLTNLNRIDKITAENAEITRKGKNWYVSVDGCIITVNAYSYTIITAHRRE